MADELIPAAAGKENRKEPQSADSGVRRQNEDLSVLHETAIALINRLDIDDLLESIVKQAGRLVGAQHGHLYLVDKEHGEIEVKVACGDASPFLGHRLEEGEGLAGRVWQTGEPLVIDDYDRWPYRSLTSPHLPQHGVVGIPLKSGTQVVAVLVLTHAEPGRGFGDEALSVLGRFAELASLALENARQYTEARRLSDRLAHQAYHDSLTGLPNRLLFSDRLQQALADAERHRQAAAVLFIDLDRFKVINDSLGHQAGDALLVEVADRLRRSLRASDVVARLGGDEFVVILGDADQASDVERIARNLLSVLSQPLQLSGHEWQTTANIGIAMYPADGIDVQTLTKNAEMAMYLAKEEGKNRYRFFTKDARNLSIQSLQLEAALRRALERGQFSLHYQPKVGMAGEGVTGVEALLRWSHPEFGAVSPAQFIPLAEETRPCRADRALGAAGGLCAGHALARLRAASSVRCRQPVAAAVCRRASFDRY
jgi:diguanylate cyclase (GGDEF)-like protein